MYTEQNISGSLQIMHVPELFCLFWFYEYLCRFVIGYMEMLKYKYNKISDDSNNKNYKPIRVVQHPVSQNICISKFHTHFWKFNV